MITRKRIPKTLAAVGATFVSAARLFGYRSTLLLASHTVWNLTLSLFRNAEQQSNQTTTLLTFSVYPDLTRIWYYFAQMSLDANVKVMVVDCCGSLRKSHFPGAQVVRFWNFSHSRKIDFFIRHLVGTRYVWICDDDVMLIDPSVAKRVHQMISQDRVAAVSLAPRGWYLKVNGETHKGMGSYCVLFDRRVFLSEGLSFSPAKTNDPSIGRISGYYDTGDYANQQLLERGYKIEFLVGEEECDHVCGFVGTSTARLSLLAGRQKVLEELFSLSMQVRAYRLVGYYCDWLVASLYRQIFEETPQWTPDLSEQETLELMAGLEGEFKEVALQQAERYRSHYRIILDAARNR